MDTPPLPRQKLTFDLDLKWVALALLTIIAVMLIIWKPWSAGAGANDRTVSVSGEAIIKATPDEYSFNPYYEFKNSDKASATSASATKQAEVVDGLKKIGVKDSQIKASVDGYGSYPYDGRNDDAESYNYTVRLTISVPTKSQAQQVQDYLLKTDPLGSVTPYPQFSDALRKKLERQARDTAIKDARSKADQSAKNLGFKVGSVKKVSDGTGFDTIQPMLAEDKAVSSAGSDAVTSLLSLQPGENEINYSVTVEYYIR